VTVFQNIPFGKLERFQKPKPFGNWDGTWDGTQRTTGQPQHPSSFDMFLSISHIWPVTNAQKEIYESNEPIKIDEKARYQRTKIGRPGPEIILRIVQTKGILFLESMSEGFVRTTTLKLIDESIDRSLLNPPLSDIDF